MRFNQMRAFSRIHRHGCAGPEGSIQKIFWSELNQPSSRSHRSYWVPMANCWPATRTRLTTGSGRTRTCEPWNTIEAGTSEVQRNIIGHFVLACPEAN